MPVFKDTFLERFLQMEAAGGILLMVATLLAVIAANSPLASLYHLFLTLPVEVRIGNLTIAKPLLLWINDGLMAIFFFLVGLELKREALEGELAERSKVMFPALGALGGMVVPAGIYVAFNYQDPVAMKGWAIPAATDIAFALGILSLLGSRVPNSLKVFLTSLAIFDDIGAILIIALFYTAKISLNALVVAGFCVLVLYVLQRRGISESSLYVAVGVVMWVALLKSGVHATLAGVILALFIPMRSRENPDHSPLKSMEHDLHSTVAFFILPVFAFANAGVNLQGMSLAQMVHGVPVGIALGLLIGKQVGVFVLCWLGIKLKLASLPDSMTWSSLYGTAVLCGVGFTMSLFIGSLAFEETGVNLVFDERLGILTGSLLSGALGYAILWSSLTSPLKTPSRS
ncbi:MAG: Na+/H+ antiporter NhaA [Nitrospinota bacterium]|nr:MAG: Na+/H+ antiporter NhaA [Nitrospinota bacterium]